MKSADRISRKLFNPTLRRHPRLTIGILVFLIAFGVRVLSWHDTRLEVGKVQTAVAGDYQRVAQLFRDDGVRGFFSPASPLADPNNLGHPPGYSVVIALTRAVFSDSNSAVQFVQIFLDSLSAVLIFLIVAELFSSIPALISGLMAAFSPQFAWNSVLLLPDSLAVFPVLLAVYLLTRARKKPRLLLFLAAGALVGISCWLRANAMLLTFFFAAAAPLIIKRESWLRYSLAIVFGTILVVLPLTIRNAIVFHRFIPLSLGAGQTLLEGIADYDSAGRFQIPNTDMGIMKQEAELANRPDYYDTLFNPDGIERERWRLRRGFAVIRSHPIWFSGVMIRRAGSMARLERSRLISTSPAPSHIGAIEHPPVWSKTPAELLSSGAILSPQTKALFEPAHPSLEITGDNSKYGVQFVSESIPVQRNTDYVLVFPVRIEKGRMKIEVTGAGESASSSAIVETDETRDGEPQPKLIELYFVANDEQVRISISNEASNPANPVVKIGDVRLYELGPARFMWTRYPRLLVHAIQKLFITAIILPLAIIGLALVIIRKHSAALVILSVVPAYYFCVQSAFHTEYRYVLAMNYFMFAFAAVGIFWIGDLTTKKLSPLFPRQKDKERGHEA